MSVRSKLLEYFPPPRFLSMPAVGIDISDYSVKFLEFIPTKGGLQLGRFGGEKIPPGIVASGRIKDHDALVEILKTMRKKHGLRFIRASLPEELGYLFDTEAPNGSREEVHTSLEFAVEENVPIPPSEAVFDFDYISGSAAKNKKRTKSVVASVFPRAEVESYTQLFTRAGLVPLSLEIEAQALARAVVPKGDNRTHMIVDFGKRRSGISLVGGGVTRFAATIDVGGDSINEAIKKAYPKLGDDAIDRMKNEKGLNGFQDTPEAKEALLNVVYEIVEAINKYNRFWQTHVKDDPSEQALAEVHLCGGNANLAGLPEHISNSIGVPVKRAAVWQNAFSLEEKVPEIHFRHSLGYAPAIGLALHSDM